MTSQSAPMLEAVRLRRLHADRQHCLLDDVSLEVHAGRPLGVMGSSGAGKTLLLRALAMLDPVDSGEVRFQGHVARRASVPWFRCQVIYLHQRPVLPGATVEAALRQPFALVAHRRRRFEEARAVELLGRVGRDASFLEKPTANLSGGEQQLSALVRAMQLDPVILLLDEPAASLDRDATLAVETLLAEWLEESPGQHSYVWVGHDFQQTQRMTHEMAFIHGGRVTREPA